TRRLLRRPRQQGRRQQRQAPLRRLGLTGRRGGPGAGAAARAVTCLPRPGDRGRPHAAGRGNQHSRTAREDTSMLRTLAWLPDATLAACGSLVTDVGTTPDDTDTGLGTAETDDGGNNSGGNSGGNNNGVNSGGNDGGNNGDPLPSGDVPMIVEI